MQIPFFVSSFLGGTGLLIVVSVGLDLIQRIEANLLMRNYKGFMIHPVRVVLEHHQGDLAVHKRYTNG